MAAQAIHRNDPGMFQAAGNLRLQQEAGQRGRVVGEPLWQLFEGDRAVQFAVEGEKHFAQATAGMRSDDLKTSARDHGGMVADGIGTIRVADESGVCDRRGRIENLQCV